MQNSNFNAPKIGVETYPKHFQIFGTFLITQADAKAYMYAISPLRRVHRFRDIQVNLYI